MEPTSSPRVGCATTSSFELLGQLARDHDLLLVAAGQVPDRHVDAGRAHVEAPRPARARVVGDRAAPRSTPRRERRAAVAVEHEVVGDRERRDQTVLAAVLGHVADAQLVDLARRQPADVGAVDRDAAADARAHPGDRLDQLALAVALHAGDAEDLAGAHGEVDAGHDRHAAVVGDRADRAPPAPPCRAARALGHLEDDLAPDHERREVAVVAALGSADRPPARRAAR